MKQDKVNQFLVILILCFGFFEANYYSYAKNTAKSVPETPLIAYYFPSGKSCTVLFDFHLQKEQLEKLAKENKVESMSNKMLQQFNTEQITKCPNADLIIMIGSYIEGFDNYGRPDFGSRTDVVRIETNVAKLKNSLKQSENMSLKKISSFVKINIL